MGDIQTKLGLQTGAVAGKLAYAALTREEKF
jgi:hypothetical protein